MRIPASKTAYVRFDTGTHDEMDGLDYGKSTSSQPSA